MKYYRLYETTSSQELAMIKLALDKERVEYRTLFENTLTVAEAYAMGNSGAIIEVVEEDFQIAEGVLTAVGINLRYDPESERFGVVDKFYAFTEKVPVIRNMHIGYRILVLAGLIATLFFTVFYALVW